MIGFILSSSKITNELAIDFGVIPPSQLPLANNYLIKFQLDELSRFCDKVYVSLLKNDILNNPGELHKYYVDDNLSLKELIIKILNSFQDEDVLFLYGDTLIKYPKTICNDESVIYCVKKTKLEYPNWYILPDNSVMCGSFLIKKDLNRILRSINIGSLKILLDQLTINSQKVNIENKNWFDFGHFHTYFSSKKNFLQTRFFNSIESISNNFIKKSSQDIGKIIFEYNWLKSFHNLFPEITPFVRNLNLFESKTAAYEIEYINYPSLSDMFVIGKHDNGVKLYIIQNLIKTINNIQSKSPKKNINDNFILEKLNSREKDILRISKEFNCHEQINKIIQSNKVFFENNNFYETIMHGDFCFSNILFDRRTDSLKLIDPRGYKNRNEGFSIYGPWVYDYFKLAHSFIGKYDCIIKGDSVESFNIEEINYNIDFFTSNTQIPRETLINGMINLFITMVPLHSDNLFRQKNFLEMAQVLNSIR